MAMQIIPFNEISGGLEGFWEDTVEINKFMIERYNCPKCRRPLIYKGYSNNTLLKNFGICEPCEFAKLFWSEPTVLVRAKNRISEKAAAK